MSIAPPRKERQASRLWMVCSTIFSCLEIEQLAKGILINTHTCVILTMRKIETMHLRSNHMRIALLSDIHGNPLALDAVLTDIEAQGGVDTYWLLGDFSSLGYDPVGVLERVTKL